MSRNTGPIQVIPPGLMGFLQLKNGGQLPDTLMGSVQPSLEVGEWMLQADRTLLSSTVTLAAAAIAATLPFSPAIQIPDREAWYIWDITLKLIIDIGDSFDGQIGAVTSQKTIQGGVALSPQLTAAAAAASQVLGVSGQPRRIYLPGTTVLGTYSGFTNVTNTSLLAVYVEYTPCPL